jgi:hypothetical protein
VYDSGVVELLRAHIFCHEGDEFHISGIIFPARIVGVLYVAGGNHALRLVEAGRLEIGRDRVRAAEQVPLRRPAIS